MSIAPVFPLLSGAPPVTAIIGTSPVRCYPAGYIPESKNGDPNQYLPCVTWQLVGGHVANCLADRPQIDNQRIQIDCWALTYPQAITLKDAVLAALELDGYCTSFNGNEYESDTKRYRQSLDFSFWTPR